MLLLDDDDELPAEPDERERALTEELGEAALRAIDEALLAELGTSRYKVARIILGALERGGYPKMDDAYIDLHARRVIALVEAGSLVAFGNLRRPRFSEVRRPARVGPTLH